MAEARILNVNDDPIARQSVTRVLRDAGFEVREVAGGQEAVLTEAAQLTDLVILAGPLGDGDGFAATRRIRANPETRLLPLVQLSTNADGEARALALQAGADAYVTQPLEPAALLTTVREVLHAHHAERELRRTLEQNSAILQHIADAVTAQNAAGKVIYANDAALRLLGFQSK